MFSPFARWTVPTDGPERGATEGQRHVHYDDYPRHRTRNDTGEEKRGRPRKPELVCGLG